MLKPFISNKYNGQVWRLEIDKQRDILCVEVRSTADKQVSFAAIDLLTGQEYFHDLQTPERWLAGMEAAAHGVLLFHHFISTDGPGHKGLIATDIKTGGTLWQNYNYAFHHLSTDGIVVFDVRIQPQKLFTLNIFTGDTVQGGQTDNDIQSDNDIILPDILPAQAAGALPDNLTAYGNIVHALHHNNYRIVSLHTLLKGLLQQHLFVISVDDNTVLFDDLLNSGITKIQPEAFVLYKNRLIWVKDKQEINVLNL